MNQMKTQILSILVCLALISHVAFGNDGKYIEAMQKNIKGIYEAKDIPAFQNSVNSFERIALVEKTKWEPLYYVAFGNIMIANQEKDNAKKDSYLDKAMEAIQQAKTLAPGESEIVALEGFVSMLRIAIDPPTRGMVYAPKATEAYQRALAMNPENPRAMALLAQMQFGTAQFFNSPATEACALNEQAAAKLQSYKSNNPLAPTWGKGMIESLKEKCK
jgi:hypothetical protein